MRIMSRLFTTTLASAMFAGVLLGGATSAQAMDLPPQAKELFQKIVGYGATPEVAAGLLGNAMQESTMNSSAMQGGGDPSEMTCNGGRSSGGSDAIGLFQWDSGRKNNLLCAAEAAGVPWTDVDFQLKFAFELEVEKEDPFKSPDYGANAASYCAAVPGLIDCSKVNSSGYPNGAADFLKGTYVEGATVEFTGYWERPGLPEMHTRVGTALAAYEQFKGEEGVRDGGDSEKIKEKPSEGTDKADAGSKLVKERELEGMGEVPEWGEADTPKDAKLSDLGVKDIYLVTKAGDAIASERKPTLHAAQIGISMIGMIFLLWAVIIFACAMFDRSNTVFDFKTVRAVTFGKMVYVEDKEDEGGNNVGLGKLLVRVLAGFGVGLILVSGVFFGLVETAFTLIT